MAYWKHKLFSLICCPLDFNTSPLNAVLEWTQLHYKITKARGSRVYSNLSDISLPQSFDMNLWTRPELNLARPLFPTAL